MKLSTLAISKLSTIALVTMALLAMMLGVRVSSIENAMRDHGVRTTGQIEKVEWRDKAGRSNRDRGYRLDVSFRTPDGRRFQKSFPVDTQLGRQVRHDSALTTIEVIYLPEDPTVALLKIKEGGKQAFYLAGGLFVMAIVLLVYQLRMRSESR